MKLPRFSSRRLLPLAALCLALSSSACDDAREGVSNTLTPTSPTPPGLAIPFSQAACTVTLVCGGPGPNEAPVTTPEIDSITLSTGTSPSCRADVFRNAPSPAVPVEFTVRNPAPGFGWRVRGAQDPSSMTLSPSFGFADTAGPFRASASFRSEGIGRADNPEHFTQNLVLEIFRSSGTATAFTAPTVATCSAIVWAGIVPIR